jgi:hypothetical protein
MEGLLRYFANNAASLTNFVLLNPFDCVDITPDPTSTQQVQNGVTTQSVFNSHSAGILSGDYINGTCEQEDQQYTENLRTALDGQNERTLTLSTANSYAVFAVGVLMSTSLTVSPLYMIEVLNPVIQITLNASSNRPSFRVIGAANINSVIVTKFNQSGSSTTAYSTIQYNVDSQGKITVTAASAA